MNRDSLLRLHLPGILLLTTLVISVLFFLLTPPQRVRRTLFFPGTTDLSIRSEYRLLPRTRDVEHGIRLLAEDMILGPMRIDHGRLLPRETGIRSLILQNGTLYMDLSSAAIANDASVRIPLEDALAAVRRTLAYNYRSLDEIVVTIDGQTPFEPAYREAPIGN